MAPGRRSPRQQRSRQTVAWVLEAAAQLFHEQGYAGTTTNKVAERAGVSVGSIYQYFPDKDALLAALAEQHMDQVAAEAIAVIDRAAAERAPLRTLLRRVIGHVAQAHTTRPDLHGLMASQALQHPRLRDRLRQVERSVAARLAVELRRLGVGGDDPDTRALLAVEGIDAQIHGVLLQPPPGRTREAIAEEITGLWTAALAG